MSDDPKQGTRCFAMQRAVFDCGDRLDAAEALLLLAFIRCAGGKAGMSNWFTQEQAAAWAKMTVRSVRNVSDRLTRKGLVSLTRDGARSTYRVALNEAEIVALPTSTPEPRSSAEPRSSPEPDDTTPERGSASPEPRSPSMPSSMPPPMLEDTQPPAHAGPPRAEPGSQTGADHAADPQAARDDAHPGGDPRSGGEVGGDGSDGVPPSRPVNGRGEDRAPVGQGNGSSTAASDGLLPLPGLSVDIPAVMPPIVQPWVPSARNCHGYTRADIEAMVLRCVAAIKGGGEVNPATCGTNAKVVLGLWSALGHPTPAEMAGEVELVAEWAQLSPDKLAARDIRAEGWTTGTNRCRHLKTLTVRVSWSDRLDAAKAWAANGKPTTTVTPAPPADDPLVPILAAVLEDLTINQGDATRCADPVKARRALDRLYKIGGNVGQFASTPAEWRPKLYRETAAAMLRHAAAERAREREAANG